MTPASSADEPRPGETRAERRRRLQAEQWRRAPEPDPGPYDPHLYGVHAYPDIEDAVIEEYVEDVVPPTHYTPQAYAGANRDAWPEAPPGFGPGATPTAGPDATAYAVPFPASPPPTAPSPAATPRETAGPPAGPAEYVTPDELIAPYGDGGEADVVQGIEEPPRHVAHRAYGDSAPTAASPFPTAAEPEQSTVAPFAASPPAGPAAPESPATTGQAMAGGPAPRDAASAAGGPANAAAGAAAAAALPPLADPADAEDPAAAAARLQLLAAKAAADRLAAPRPAIAPNAAQEARDRAAQAERERRAAEKIAADKVAAARLAAVRAAAAQRESGAARAVRAENQLAQAAPTARRALPSGPATGSPAPTGTGPAAGTAGPARKAQARPAKVTPRWAKVAYSTAALAVLAGGVAITVPHAGALISLGQPAPSPTESAAAPASPSSSESATGTASTAAAPTAVSSAMACDPAQWAGELTGEAPETFTASAVAQAYCLTAGTMRDIGFTELAAKKSTPYTVADFAFVGPYLSPALKAKWDKDVAEFVASQDLAGAAAKRISALTFLAWDATGSSFDPAVKVRSTDFAVGKPVTWVVKGSDGVARLGVGFETGIVTHMLDASGRKQDKILKRTYKVLLVKGDAAHPWLIDAYEIGQTTAALSTTTAAPTAAPTAAGAGGKATATATR